MSAHAPGPWTVRVNGRGATLIENASGCAVAEAFALRDGGGTIESAQLIAAAPDLLAALERIAAMDVTNAQAAILARNEARAAIAKAVQS